MAKPRSARRNIAFVVLCFLSVGGLLALARFNQSRGPILPPEPPESVALRIDPARNAWHGLRDALLLLPPPPPPLQSPEGPGGRAMGPYEAQSGSLGSICSVSRPDDPVLIEYLVKCRPAVKKMHAAVAKRVLLFPGCKYTNDAGAPKLMNEMFRLSRVAIACAHLNRTSQADRVRLVQDFLDLSFMLSSDYYPFSPRPSREVVPVLRKLDARHLRQLLDWLNLRRRTISAPIKCLENWIRALDAPRAGIDWREVARRPARSAEYAYLRSRQKTALRRNRDAFFEAAGLEFYKLAEFQNLHPGTRDIPVLESVISCEGSCIAYSNWLAQIDGLAIAAALELHRSQHGDYPESLDALEPYLYRQPVDPFTGKPFIYRREDRDYVLYACGTDQKDNNGERDVLVRCRGE